MYSNFSSKADTIILKGCLMKIRLIDVVFLSVALFAGIYCGRWAGSTYGIIGHIVGFVLGAIAALVFLFSFFYFLDFVLNLCGPRYPVCKNGKCSFRHYTYVKSLDDGTGAIYCCKCKIKYVMKWEDGLRPKKALELLDDGTTRLYKKYVRYFIIFGRWKDDFEEPKKSDTNGNPGAETDL